MLEQECRNASFCFSGTYGWSQRAPQTLGFQCIHYHFLSIWPLNFKTFMKPVVCWFATPVMTPSNKWDQCVSRTGLLFEVLWHLGSNVRTKFKSKDHLEGFLMPFCCIVSLWSRVAILITVQVTHHTLVFSLQKSENHVPTVAPVLREGDRQAERQKNV